MSAIWDDTGRRKQESHSIGELVACAHLLQLRCLAPCTGERCRIGRATQRTTAAKRGSHASAVREKRHSKRQQSNLAHFEEVVAHVVDCHGHLILVFAHKALSKSNAALALREENRITREDTSATRITRQTDSVLTVVG